MTGLFSPTVIGFSPEFSLYLFTFLISFVGFMISMIFPFDYYLFSFVVLLIFFTFLFISKEIYSLKPAHIATFLAFFSFHINYLVTGKLYHYDLCIFNLSAFYITMCIYALLLGFYMTKERCSKIKFDVFGYYPSRAIILLLGLFSIAVTLFFNVIGYKTTHTAVAEKSIFIFDLLIFIKNSLNSILYFDLFFHLLHKKRVKYQIIEFLLVFINIFFGLTSGSRGAVLIGLFIVPYLYILIKRQIPFKMIAFALLFLVFIIPVSLAYRESSLFSTVSNRSISSKIPAILNALKSIEINGTVIAFAFAYIFGRFSRLEQSLRIIDWSPAKTPYMYGRTIFPHILISLVPTALYPDRPLSNIGKWFGVTYAFTEPKNPVFITAGIFNELYINFSVFGLFGCFLGGLIMKKIYSFWKYHKDSLFVNLFYFSFWNGLCFWLNEAYIVSGILDFVKSTIILFFVFICIYFIDGNKKRLCWEEKPWKN